MSRLQGSPHSTASNLPDLFEAWGLQMPENTFAGDRDLAVEGSTAPNRRPEKILAILKFDRAKGCFNQEHVVSAAERGNDDVPRRSDGKKDSQMQQICAIPADYDNQSRQPLAGQFP